MAGRPDAVSATSRTAVTPIAPNDGRSRDGATDTRGTTAVTAEIPAVPVAPAYGVLLPDGSIWYPGSKRKLPAPTYLRVTVWSLAFLVLLAVAGLIVEHYHPVWMDPIRHVVATPGQPAGSGPGSHHVTTTTTPSTNQGSSGKMTRTAATATAVAYSVPGASFSFDIKATRDCDVVVTSVKNGAYLFNSVIPGGTSKLVSVASGAAVLKAFAGGASLVVSSGGKTVGTIPALAYAVAYTFSPTNS